MFFAAPGMKEGPRRKEGRKALEGGKEGRKKERKEGRKEAKPLRSLGSTARMTPLYLFRSMAPQKWAS